jgi:elongation factor Ts
MSVSIQQIQSLRGRTGVSMMAVKNALEEANGDEEAALELLRKRGEAQSAKKADREQSEGLVFAASNDVKATLVFIKCETDFVARDDGFQEMGQSLADALLSSEAEFQAKSEEVIPAAVLKLGENITVGDKVEVEAPVVGTYVHTNGKIGVIVGLDGSDSDHAKDAAMHAAAMNPAVISPDDVTEELVTKEKEIWTEQLSAEGKPAEIMGKIMIGKEKKFREESALIAQAFVKDPETTVGDYVGANVTAYERLAV